MSRQCAFLTTDDFDDGVLTDDERAIDPMAGRGWQVELVPWRRPGVDWDRFEAVVVRSPWDYPARLDAFLSVLGKIDRSAARLENRLSLIEWNARKTYLRDLEAAGVPVLPTLWNESFEAERAGRLFEELGAKEIVVKPVVGVGANGAFRLTRGEDPACFERAEAALGGSYMAQPFVRSVVEEGEYSLIFLNGTYSHAALKTPARGDFRVQHQYDGQIRAVEPEPSLMEAAEAALAAAPGPAPLYARVDLSRTGEDAFALMELELIEPSLYLRTDASAPERLADAFVEWMGHSPRTGS